MRRSCREALFEPGHFRQAPVDRRRGPRLDLRATTKSDCI